jgi:hypothetical protein
MLTGLSGAAAAVAAAVDTVNTVAAAAADTVAAATHDLDATVGAAAGAANAHVENAAVATAAKPAAAAAAKTASSPAAKKPSAGTGACAGVSAWAQGAVYTAGKKAMFAGHVFTAKWWTQGDAPDINDAWGVWKNGGACGASGGAKRAHARMQMHAHGRSRAAPRRVGAWGEEED